MCANRPDAATVAITGASGALGQALCSRFLRAGWLVVALSTSSPPENDAGAPSWKGIRWVTWRCGEESELLSLLRGVDLLVINHGLNVHGDRSAEAVQRSLEVNAMSGLRLLEAFLHCSEAGVGATSRREVWVNTSEAEVIPAFSPLYEISKRLLGQLVSLRRLDAGRYGVRVRTLVLGPFRSSLNPAGLMNPDFLAGEILRQASWPLPWIVVTPNPLTWLLLPCNELVRWGYFGLFSQWSPENSDP